MDAELLVKLKAIDELTPVMAKAVAVMEQQTNALVQTMEKLADGSAKAKDKNEGLNTGMINFAATMSVVKGAVEIAHKAYEALEATFEKAIDEAIEAEKANNRLAGALVATGNYTEKNVKAIEKYAEEIKALTGVSDESVKVMVSQGLQMGLNIAQSQKMETAARQLAAATGKDVNDAFSLLSGSLTGQSRGLAKILPQVKQLTEAQLKSGEAADIVTKAFGAQYALYEKSFSVSVTKAKTAINDMYKALGEIIIQNPAVIKGIAMVAEGANMVAEKIKEMGKWIEANQEVLERLGTALFKVGQLIFDMIAIAIKPLMILFQELPGPMMIVTAAIIAMTGPVGILFVAIGALTAAFAKWPGLFDVIEGAFKQMAAFFIEGIAIIMKGYAELISVVNTKWGNALKEASAKVENYAMELNHTGDAQRELGLETNAAADIAFKSADAHENETKVLGKNMVAASQDAKAHKDLAESYAGVVLGSLKAQEALQGEVQQRDKDLKHFTEYLEAKKRLAISKKQEQDLQMAQLQSKETGGGSGETAIKTKLNAEIQLETQHQAQLGALRKAGAITAAQYDEAMFDSRQKMRTLDEQNEMAHQQAIANVYADSPAGYENQRKIEEQAFNAKLQAQSEQLSRLGQNEAQIAQFQNQSREQFRQQQYDSQKAHDEKMILLATESQQRKADAMGDTPEAMQLKQQISEQQFQMDLQNKMLHAQQEGATTAEIDAMKQTAELDHKNAMTQINVDYYDREAERQEKAGNDWEAFLARRNAAMAQHGAIMGTLQTVQSSQYYKAEQQMLTDLSSLRSSKSKGMFEVGKSAAIAQATVNTFMGATAAFTSLAGIPIVGPALGALAAAAAIASGLNQISQIKSQKFTGGQADSGMDSVPQHLDGKSFVLSGGERVVQPTANKELTDFLASEKQNQQPGAGGRSGAINITLNYQGNMAKDDVKKMVDLIVPELRARSERGTPIISSKGVV